MSSEMQGHRPRTHEVLEDGQMRSGFKEALWGLSMWALLCLLIGLLVPHAHAQTAASPAGGSARPLVVSVVPQFPAVDIHRTWSPLLERLAHETGLSFVLKVARDIPSFEAEVMAGEPDFAYLNPYHQLLAHQAQGYVPLVRDDTPLKGLLVVRADSPYRKPQDLQGQTLAFPSPLAFGASMMVRAQLIERERVQFQTTYARTHTNTYRQVAAGLAAAAGGLQATLEREPEALRAQLRVLFETAGTAPHPLSAHPRMAAATRQAIIRAWMKLAQDPTLAPHFKGIPMDHPVTADHDRDYAPLASLHLARLPD